MSFLDKLLGAVQLNDESSDFIEHDYYDDDDYEEDEDELIDLDEDELDDNFYKEEKPNKKFAERFRSRKDQKKKEISESERKENRSDKRPDKLKETKKEKNKERTRKYVEEDEYDDDIDSIDDLDELEDIVDDDDMEETESRDRKRAKEPLFRPSFVKKTEKSSSSRSQRRTKTESAPRSSKITQMRNSRKSSTGGSDDMEVCVIKPSSVEDAKEIADALIDDCIVLLNLEGVDTDLAQRIFDIATGACYALDGALTKASGFMYILAPKSVMISGDIQNILNESKSYVSSAY